MLIRSIIQSTLFKFRKNQEIHSERGFTLVDTLLSLAVVSIASATLFTVITAMNNMDTENKQNKLTYDLLTPYLDYYKTVEINRKNYRNFATDFTTVDLVHEIENRAYIENLVNRANGLGITETDEAEKITNEKEYVMYLEGLLNPIDTRTALKEAQLPNMYNDLNIVCTNNPHIVQEDSKGYGTSLGAKYDAYVVFNIKCMKNDKSINGDLNSYIDDTNTVSTDSNFTNSYTVVRYIEN